MTSYLSDLLVPDTALSVAGLTIYIQALLEQDTQLRQVWVTGEVSSATQYRSGLFFTLQDPAEKAAISCVVWNSQIDRLATLPTQGEQFILLGRIQVHLQRGQYQLIVWQVLPAGEGLRALRYRQLRHRLEAEGLFDHGSRHCPFILGWWQWSLRLKQRRGATFNERCGDGIQVYVCCFLQR